jgi:deoxyadenosine/deoxycytidine kinase
MMAAHGLRRVRPLYPSLTRCFASSNAGGFAASSASPGSSSGVRIVSIDGLIGAGKSTLCDQLRVSGHAVAKEPLQEWRVGGHDLLQTFYNDPHRYAYLFQTHCLRSRVVQVQEGLASFVSSTPPQDPTSAVTEIAADSSEAEAPLFFMERGVASDAVFAETQHKMGHINDIEYASYRYQYEQARNDTPSPSGRIYVHASVDSCAARILSRSRNGEGAIDQGYLKLLDMAHEEWLQRERDRGVPVLVLDGEADMRNSAVAEQIIQSVEDWAASICR